MSGVYLKLFKGDTEMVEQNVNYKDINFHLERCLEMCNVYAVSNSKAHYDYSLQTLRTIYTLYYSPCYITFVTDVIDIVRTMSLQCSLNKNKIFSLLIEQMSLVLD